MRAARILLAALFALVPAAQAAAARTPPTPQQALTSALNQQMRGLGAYAGAEVVDLTTGQRLYAVDAATPRLPASVEKLYTTTVALLEFGPNGTLTTQLRGVGTRTASGTWAGRLYLRGGGDPTFGTARFDSAAYGTGATVGRLVLAFRTANHIHAIRGPVIGDETYFDSLRSTSESNFAFDPYMEGSLSALAFNRGLLANGAEILDPPVYAGRQLVAALRSAHIRVPHGERVRSGRTPADARLLASVSSPPMSKLIALTNTPSDNFFAETLTKDLGARFGAGGTTADGVAVIRAQLARHFGLAPRFVDGSGLSRADATSPAQVVTLLGDQAQDTTFTSSLAVAGETGTLVDEMRGTVAQNDCRGKTGTLSDVASLAGYCTAADGHTLAFAILANALGNPALGHTIEANMAVAMARYSG
jgi:D-alanyl-D-alanine carboxypeptidase/D-alanyl-D-alanine-endopeptidase (penicillin-binding protein 4)